MVLPHSLNCASNLMITTVLLQIGQKDKTFEKPALKLLKLKAILLAHSLSNCFLHRVFSWQGNSFFWPLSMHKACNLSFMCCANFRKFCETRLLGANPGNLCWLKTKLVLGSHQAVDQSLLTLLGQALPLLSVFLTSFQQRGAILRHASQGLLQ